jgi:hypothetical protein
MTGAPNDPQDAGKRDSSQTDESPAMPAEKAPSDADLDLDSDEAEDSVDDVAKFVGDLDREGQQESDVLHGEGAYFSDDAPDAGTLVRRAREYDDLPKHIVRVEHWLKMAKSLFKAKGKGLRLLTLPGRYALEVALYHRNGLLEERTENGNTTVYAVGFETSPDVFGLLQSGPQRFFRLFDGDLIDTLADPNAPHRKELTQLFPFDIINLDLTVNLVAPSEGPYGPVLAAIRDCFKLQGAQPDDWALMVTFRAGLPETDSRAIAAWREEFQRNLDTHPSVKDACFQAHGCATVNELFEQDEEEALAQVAAKWIAEQAHACNWQVRSARQLWYTRQHDGGTYTIRKIVFRFSIAARLPQYAMPTKEIPTMPWHIEDLVSVVKARSNDIDEAILRLRGREDSDRKIGVLLEDIDSLKAWIDGSAT